MGRRRKKKKVVEFTKIVLLVVIVLYLVVVGVGIALSFIDYTQYSTLAILVGPPTATAIGFYAWKAKAENVIKIKQEHPEETKGVPVDLNNISGSN